MSDGGRVVIPAEIRHSMGLKEGDTVLWELRGGEAVLTFMNPERRPVECNMCASSDGPKL